MKHWRYIEPTSAADATPVVQTWSEAEILASYFPYWSAQMRKAGKAAQISEQACLEDWVVVHWAEPVGPPQEEP